MIVFSKHYSEFSIFIDAFSINHHKPAFRLGRIMLAVIPFVL